MKAQSELTGRHVAMIFVSAFAVIIGVNILLAVNAVRSFPGLEVRNSYVASQQFDVARQAQLALGWTVRARASAGAVHLRIVDKDGKPAIVDRIDAVLGRATHVQDDVQLDFKFDGAEYVAPAVIGGGNWNIRMTAVATDGTEFNQRVILHVNEDE